MKILQKLDDVRQRYNRVQTAISEKQKEINKLLSEQMRLEGEHRAFLHLAKEEGTIDEDGNLIEDEVDAEETPLEDAK